MTSPGRPSASVAIAIALAALLVSAIVVGLFVAGSSGGTSLKALGPPRFADIRATSGIDHRYEGDFQHAVGGGVAAFDCDDDRRPELYLAGGSAAAAMYHNDSSPGAPPSFTPLDRAELALSGVTGAYPLDIDSDGMTDLAVMRVGEDVLLRGLGGCRFERANEAWGFDGGDAWTTAFSATWEPGATWPTLAFGSYLMLTGGQPDRSGCADGVFLRPAATGAPYTETVPLSPSWCSLSLQFSDWSRTGQRDLRVSNDRHYYSDYSDGQEQLWRVVPGEPPRQYTADDGWQRVRVEGMGIASQDVTGDGLPEVYLTSQAASRLETLASGPERPEYRNMAHEAGVEGAQPSVGDEHLPSTAWHAQFEDVNNDGLMDLFVTKGNVDAQPGYAQHDPNELYLGQPDGTFQVRTADAGILDVERSRGASLVDLDLDGLLDLVVVERNAPAGVWWNLGAGEPGTPVLMGHWLGIELAQAGTNHDAVGAWIEVRSDGRTIAREVTVGGGHASGALVPVHVGLGTATRAEVRVQWPGGDWGPWMPVDADRYVVIERGAAAPVPVSP
ncbi:MAG: CRTAC1 family protein [Candidatus Limnocylindrales bacterium]